MTSRASKALLDFDPSRPVATAADAATVIVVRDSEDGAEIFCVERNKKSKFLGGAIVFPGGKVDAFDRDPIWNELTNEPPLARDDFASHKEDATSLAVAALRETLEEAALLLATSEISHETALSLRDNMFLNPNSLPSFLQIKKLQLDTCKLHPFSRWITPEAETRRFDTRFYLAMAPSGQNGAHDMKETMASFWARPTDLLARFDAREIQLAPPTHRTLEILAMAKTAHAMVEMARRSTLLPICPKLVPHEETLALVLPGDREHDVSESRVAGRSRYVLRDGYWLSEDAP